MKVYNGRGEFITRAERRRIADEQKDRRAIIIALVVLAGILIYCAVTKTELYL